MEELELHFAWVGVSKFDYEMKYESGQAFFRWSPVSPWLPMRDEDMERFGFTRQETVESRLARAEWRIAQLEAELQERRDRRIEMQERE